MAQLKIYEAKESANGYLPKGTPELLGAPRGRSQGDWYIVAHTSAEAVEIANRVGVPYVSNPRHLRVWGRSVYAEAMKARGYLNVPGEVIAHRSHSPSALVARNLGEGWEIIGRFEYDHRAHCQSFINQED